MYANGGGKASSHGAGYHLANAAFTSQPAVYLGQVGGASRTHTNGFSFHPPHGTNIHKYSNSLYGDDVKPKVAGKDVLHALGSSNGFSSGYSSDPYNSVMSSGLPATLSHSNRPAICADSYALKKQNPLVYGGKFAVRYAHIHIPTDNL